MNLKNPSMSSAVALVGVGLISLSGAMIFVASGRSALAASGLDGRGGTRTLPITAEPGMPTALEGAPPVMAMGAADGCVEGEPLEWFGEIRELPACWITENPIFQRLEIGVPVLALDTISGAGFRGSLFDVNGDGRPEAIEPRFRRFGVEPCVLALIAFSRQGDELVRTRYCVLSGEVLSKAINAAGIPTEEVIVADAGWSDVDADGDLDFLLLVTRGFDNASAKLLWLENTNFEATQPLTGDLNSDGNVNSTDLALLLGGWTGS